MNLRMNSAIRTKVIGGTPRQGAFSVRFISFTQALCSSVVNACGVLRERARSRSRTVSRSPTRREIADPSPRLTEAETEARKLFWRAPPLF
jgi:hypothetical protein